MKHLNNYMVFLEMNNPNTPDGYLKSLANKPKAKIQINSQQKKPTDQVDTILQNTEDQKEKILAQKDAIEKELLNKNVLEPDNKVTAKNLVKDYKNQISEFDKTVNQIDKLKQTLSKSNVNKPISYMKQAREKNL